jgi:hypothetical protein
MGRACASRYCSKFRLVLNSVVVESCLDDNNNQIPEEANILKEGGEPDLAHVKSSSRRLKSAKSSYCVRCQSLVTRLLQIIS